MQDFSHQQYVIPKSLRFLHWPSKNMLAGLDFHGFSQTLPKLSKFPEPHRIGSQEGQPHRPIFVKKIYTQRAKLLKPYVFCCENNKVSWKLRNLLLGMICLGMILALCSLRNLPTTKNILRGRRGITGTCDIQSRSLKVSFPVHWLLQKGPKVTSYKIGTHNSMYRV